MLPAGVPGELVYRPAMPDAMARGYYKDPEATAKAFRNFMFHTGDVGFVDEEGRVHFSGRSQDRIRRRGENISAAELEFIAAAHEEVVECAAYGVPGELGEHEVKLDVYPRARDVRRARVPPLARRAAAALHGPALHRGASPASCPRRRARRSRSSSSPRPAWTGPR